MEINGQGKYHPNESLMKCIWWIRNFGSLIVQELKFGGNRVFLCFFFNVFLNKIILEWDMTWCSFGVRYPDMFVITGLWGWDHSWSIPMFADFPDILDGCWAVSPSINHHYPSQNAIIGGYSPVSDTPILLLGGFRYWLSSDFFDHILGWWLP